MIWNNQISTSITTTHLLAGRNIYETHRSPLLHLAFILRFLYISSKGYRSSSHPRIDKDTNEPSNIDLYTYLLASEYPDTYVYTHDRSNT